MRGKYRAFSLEHKRKIQWETEQIVNLIPGRTSEKYTTIREYLDAIQIAQSDTAIKVINMEKMEILLLEKPTKID